MDYQKLQSLYDMYVELEEELENTIGEEERNDVKREMSMVKDLIKKEKQLLDDFDYECKTKDDFTADDDYERRKLGEI